MPHNNQYMKPWTDEEIEVLKSHYNRFTDKELSQKIGRTRKAIQFKRSELDLLKPSNFGFKIGVLRNNLNFLKQKRGSIRKIALNGMQIGMIVGLIEGEGGMGLLIHKQSNHRYLRPYITVSNTNIEILDWLRSTIGLGSISKPRRKEPHHKRVCHYGLYGQTSVLPLLRLLEPHFITERRKKQVNLIIEFCERRRNVLEKGCMPYNWRDVEVFLELRKLNPKGPNPKILEWIEELPLE